MAPPRMTRCAVHRAARRATTRADQPACRSAVSVCATSAEYASFLWQAHWQARHAPPHALRPARRARAGTLPLTLASLAQETQAAFSNALRGVFLTPLKTTAFRALVTRARRSMPALPCPLPLLLRGPCACAVS